MDKMVIYCIATMSLERANLIDQPFVKPWNRNPVYCNPKWNSQLERERDKKTHSDHKFLFFFYLHLQFYSERFTVLQESNVLIMTGANTTLMFIYSKKPSTTKTGEEGGRVPFCDYNDTETP